MRHCTLCFSMTQHFLAAISVRTEVSRISFCTDLKLLICLVLILAYLLDLQDINLSLLRNSGLCNLEFGQQLSWHLVKMRSTPLPSRLASLLHVLLLTSPSFVHASAIPNNERRQDSACRRTKVAIL